MAGKSSLLIAIPRGFLPATWQKKQNQSRQTFRFYQGRPYTYLTIMSSFELSLNELLLAENTIFIVLRL